MSLIDALENPEVIRQRKLAHRRAVWDRIQGESPDVADFIEQATRVFGKPDRLIYTAPNGDVLDPSAYDKKGGIDD